MPDNIDLSLNLPAELLDALIMQESNYNSKAVNRKSGATGLGQITKPALQDFNRLNKENYTMSDMFDAQKNTRVTNWYLYDRIPEMLNAYNLPINIDNVLASYNFGIGNVRKNKPYPKETVNYIGNIKQNVEKAKQGLLFGGTEFTGGL